MPKGAKRSNRIIRWAPPPPLRHGQMPDPERLTALAELADNPCSGTGACADPESCPHWGVILEDVPVGAERAGWMRLAEKQYPHYGWDFVSRTTRPGGGEPKADGKRKDLKTLWGKCIRPGDAVPTEADEEPQV